MASLRRLATALALLAFAGWPGLVWAADAFAVRGLDVDVTAANVAAAKEQAIAEAERAGFRRLLERLTMPADHARLPGGDALQYVRDVAIEQERSSAVRYIATLTVRYNPVAVKKLLRDAGVKYAEPRPRAVVIVPVFKPAPTAKPVLWDGSNPWRNAWQTLGSGALVPLALPAGDQADSVALSPEKALGLDAEALGALGAKVRSSDVMVAAVSVNAAGNGLDASLSGLPGTPRPFETKTYPIGEAGLDAALRAAAVDIAQALDNGYKQGNLLSFDRAASLSAMAPLRGFEDWLAIRERLGRVPLVRRWEIISLSRDEAALTLYTLGEPDQVKSVLAAAGLSLDWGDGFWTLRVK